MRPRAASFRNYCGCYKDAFVNGQHTLGLRLFQCRSKRRNTLRFKLRVRVEPASSARHVLAAEAEGLSGILREIADLADPRNRDHVQS